MTKALQSKSFFVVVNGIINLRNLFGGELMDTIIATILFVLPGVIISLLYKRFKPTSRKEPSNYESTVIAFLYSTIIILINLTIIKLFFNQKISTFDQLQLKFKSISFLLKYSVLTIFNSTIFAWIWNWIYKKIFMKVFNNYREAKKLPIETDFPTVWDEIFENNEIDLKDSYISIEKDGQIITQGILESFSPPDSDNKELMVIESAKVKEFIENDKLLDGSEKLFDVIDREYYDFKTGVLIKFYNNKKIKDYLERFNQ